MENQANIPKLRFPEYSEDWKNRKIGKILSIGSGKDYRHLNSGEIPVYGTGGIMTKVDKHLYDGETVCIGRKGTIDKPMYFNGKIWTVDTLFYTHSFINSKPKFIFYLFQNVNWKQHNEAGGVPSLSKSTIEQINLTLPSLPEQQKIASFLTTVDDKLQALKNKKSLLELYKKGVMQKIFSQELRFRDDNGSEYPEWEEKKLGANIEFLSGIAFKGHEISENNKGTPILRGINITEGVIRHTTQIDRYYIGSDVSRFEKYIVEENDLVIGMDGSKVGKNVALIKKDDAKSILIQRVARIRASKKADIHFIYQNIFSKKFHDYVDVVNTSSGIPHISAQQIKDFKIKFPIVNEQTKIANFLSALDEKIHHVQGQIEKMELWKKGLLQKMFV